MPSEIYIAHNGEPDEVLKVFPDNKPINPTTYLLRGFYVNVRLRQNKIRGHSFSIASEDKAVAEGTGNNNRRATGPNLKPKPIGHRLLIKWVESKRIG